MSEKNPKLQKENDDYYIYTDPCAFRLHLYTHILNNIDVVSL